MQSKETLLTFNPFLYKFRLSMAGASLVAMFALLPVFQILDANPFFHYQFGFDETILALILICFGLGPLAVHLIFVKYILGKSRDIFYIRIILGLSTLLFISHLYSTMLAEFSSLTKTGVLLLIASVGILAIKKAPMEIIWGLAWLSLIIIPTVMYHGYNQYKSIPKLAEESEAITDEKEIGPRNIYMFFLDGSIITSSHLDGDLYPKENILPNLRNFLKEDSHWFPNSLANGPKTYISFPTMVTGNRYKHVFKGYPSEDIFNIINNRFDYNMTILLSSKTDLCKKRPKACVINTLYSQPIKILFEMYRQISTFMIYPVNFELNHLNQKGKIIPLLRQRMVSVLMNGIKNDSGSNNFYIIQLFDRGEKDLKKFDKLLGEFIAKLKEKGQYEESIILIMSDHGFNQVGKVRRYGVDAEQTWAVYKVPFAIKTPGIGSGKLYKYRAQGIDIAPTLLAQILPANDYDRLKFDGINVLSDKPVREHYISFGEKDVLYQLVDKVGGKPVIVKVPINQIKALSED